MSDPYTQRRPTHRPPAGPARRLPAALAAMLAASLIAVLAIPSAAQNCDRTKTGLVPLTDLGAAGRYHGFDGGLYGKGANVPPDAHRTAGLAAAAAVTPRDATGRPDPNGKVVILSIGMSNTTQEFSTWKRISDADAQRHPSIVVVDGAQGGQDARKIADPKARFWSVVDQRLAQAGVTADQVQVVWLKEAVARPTVAFPGHAEELRDLLGAIARILKGRHQHLQITFLASRIYAGYATTALNPEPFAYESAFAARWVIERQIAGDPALNHDPAKGAVHASWLGWGPYLWADGLAGRKIDSLVWECRDFTADGTHPSASGRDKVAALLDAHFRGHEMTKGWYLGGGGGGKAGILRYGRGCPGGTGPLALRATGLPVIGNRSFAIGIARAAPSRPVLLMVATARAALRLDPSCTLLVEPSRIAVTVAATTSTGGSLRQPLPIPGDSGLIGLVLDTQFFVSDPTAPGLRGFGGGALTEGLELRIGT